MERVLVTGGSGVAGGGLKNIVEKNEYPDRKFIFPSSQELNLLDFGSTRRFMVDWRPDAVVHFAAISGGIKLTLNHPASVMRDNIRMNLNLLEAARVTSKPKVLFTLSAACYSPQTPVPMKEEFLHEGVPHESNYSYSFAKRLIAPMIKAYRKEYDMDLVGIISGAIIGPRSNFNPNSSTAVPGMIRHFYENKDSPIEIEEDGTPIRQFTSDEDIGRIAMWFIDNYSDQNVLNISTPEETPIKDAAYMIAEFMNLSKNQVSFGAAKPRGVHSQSLDSSRFIGLSGFEYEPTRDAIKRTVEYFVKHYPDQRKLRL